MEAKSDGQGFYRWVDAQGRLHLVSSLEAIPPAERARAQLVVLNSDDSVQRYELPGGGWRPDWASFACGFGAALLLALVLKLLPNGARSLTRLVVGVAVVALLASAYFGFVRRSTGTGNVSALATPSALINDAKSAVDKMNERQQQQDEAIRQIQAEGRGAPPASSVR